MEQDDKPTYNKLHFAEMSQALKSNISRRKAAKQEQEQKHDDEASKSD